MYCAFFFSRPSQFNNEQKKITTPKNMTTFESIIIPQKKMVDFEKCLMHVEINMPRHILSNQLVAHHWDAGTGKWNEEMRWSQLQLGTAGAPCLIWYIGANTEGRDGIRFQKEYQCNIHVFEPIIPYGNALKVHYARQRVQRAEIFLYGLGDSNRFVKNIPLQGESSFAMSSRMIAGAKYVEIEIKQVSRVFQALTQRFNGVIDLMHVNCEGCEWELFEALVLEGILQKIKVLQFSAHYFPEISNVQQRYCRLMGHFRQTHKPIFSQPFGWERWELRSER